MAFRRLGRLPQGKDDRDRMFSAPLHLVGAPPSYVCLSARMPAPIDQADEGACGPNTAAEVIMYDQKAEGLPVACPSRNFIYFNTRLYQGTSNVDSGVNNRAMLKTLAKSGFCPETMWPYTRQDMLKKPTEDCYKAAIPIGEYQAIEVNEQDMKACIASGYPFIFGFDVYKGMLTDLASVTGIVPRPHWWQTPLGGHDIAAYGYDDRTKLLRCRNHWVNDDGKPWGDHGDALIPYAYAFNKNLASDLWMIRTIPGRAA